MLQSLVENSLLSCFHLKESCFNYFSLTASSTVQCCKDEKWQELYWGGGLTSNSYVA